MYLLLVCEAALFSMEFLFSRRFKNSRGDNTESTLCFLIYTGIARFVLLWALNGFCIQFTRYSFFMAAVYSIAAMTAAFFSLKALSAVNLSIFSIFIMLGGMALPFLCGVVFFGEALMGEKLICFAMMAAAMILTYEKGDSTLKGIFLCMGVFIANGAFGVISKIHQSSQLPAADSRSFLMLCSIITVPVCCAWYIAKFRRLCRPSKRETGALALYTGCNAVGDLLCFTAIRSLPASVQYPIVSGGSMVFSAVISVLAGEKVSKRNWAAVAIAVAATAVMMY